MICGSHWVCGALGNILTSSQLRTLLATQLAYHDVSVGRFPPTAFLSCCNSTRVCYRETSCTRTKLHPERKQEPDLYGKYRAELSGALLHARALESRGMRLGVMGPRAPTNCTRLPPPAKSHWGHQLRTCEPVRIAVSSSNYTALLKEHWRRLQKTIPMTELLRDANELHGLKKQTAPFAFPARSRTRVL